MADRIDLPEDDFLLAGELSLGVLEDADLARAKRKQLADADFASAVEWWNARLARMAEAGGAMAPSADVLRGIHAKLDRIEAADGSGSTIAFEPPGRARPAGWSLAFAGIGTAMAAAALALFIATPSTVSTPPGVEQPAGPQLVAQLQDEEAGRKLASVIDTASSRLSLRIEGLEPSEGQIAELWVIPADGVPRSLGEIPGSGSFERELDATEAGFLVEGSALAVTFEADEGVRHQSPTEPILLVGALDQV